MENNDISKRTVLVLLVLTLVVSIVGTWTILSQPTVIHKNIQIGPPQEGRVNLDISKDPATVLPQIAEREGKVKLNILES